MIEGGFCSRYNVWESQARRTSETGKSANYTLLSGFGIIDI